MNTEQLLLLVFRFARLKETARDGWNRTFPPGSRFKTRSVAGAESVADHSWGLAMFAFVVGVNLGLDVLKLVWMALIHDLGESITLDINTAVIEDLGERARLEAEKRLLEDEAMREIFLPYGEWGQRCYELWLEYEDQTSPEARVLKQLDKLEACVQVIIYKERGENVDPFEFLTSAERHITDPELVEMLRLLRERAGLAPS